MSDKDGEGKEPVVEEIQPDEEGKYPETVPWGKYVGIKEAWGKTKEKVASLEEQLKQAVKPEEFNKIKKELDETKTNLQQTSDELKNIKDKSVSEKKEYLKSKGIPESELAGASEKDLDILAKAIGGWKPKPDMGGGGGSGELKGSPMDLSRRAYETK